jgi:hypothetical protein
MKKLIPTIVIVFTMGLLVMLGCKAQKTPGLPYDYVPPPTATPLYNIGFTVISTQVPLVNANISLVYPDATRTITGTTNAEGYVNFQVTEKGSYTANLSHPSIYFSSNYPLYNNYDVVNGSNENIIYVDAGSLTLVSQNPNNISYTAAAGIYDYAIIYSNTQGLKRKVVPNLNGRYCTACPFITFIPPYIDTPGTSLTVKVSLPKYWVWDTSAPLFFYNLEISTSIPSSLGYPGGGPTYWGGAANWFFSCVASATVLYASSTGTLSTTMHFTISNIDITTVCVKIDKYEYLIGSNWVDASYYGGVPDYKIAGISQDFYGRHCFPNSNNFTFSLGFPGYSATSSTKARATLSFMDRDDNTILNTIIIQNL